MLQAGLQSRDIELAVGRVPHQLPGKDFNAEILFQEPVLIAAAQSNKWTRRRKVKLAELVDECWTLPPPAAIATSTLAAAFQSAKLPMPRNSVVTYSLQLHYALKPSMDSDPTTRSRGILSEKIVDVEAEVDMHAPLGIQIITKFQ